MPVTQKTINMLYDGKGIRLDVYINDDKETVYNVEMERGKQKKSFVIFICPFDPFGECRHIYTFENRCVESASITLGDETTKIFLNTKGNMHDVDPEIKEFLSYVEDTTDNFAAQARSPLIKESKEMEVEYMTLLQRDRKI